MLGHSKSLKNLKNRDLCVIILKIIFVSDLDYQLYPIGCGKRLIALRCECKNL